MDKTYLLNEEEIRDFIINGYIQIQADFPTNLHEGIYQQIEEVLAKEGIRETICFPGFLRFRGFLSIRRFAVH